MATTLPTLTPVEDSLLLTLYARALDNRLPKPILSDAMADEIVRKIDYDFEQFKVNKNFVLNVALRAKKLDEVASGFIRHHPDAVGLDLGAGLDTRAFRIAAPATVDWYDVDYPTVVAASERLIADRSNVHTIGADVTESDSRSSRVVTASLTLIQPRCSAPATLPLRSGSPPFARIASCNSLAACAHRVAPVSNSDFSSPLFASCAALRKPFSPSLDVSTSSFSVDSTSLFLIWHLRCVQPSRMTAPHAVRHAEMTDPCVGLLPSSRLLRLRIRGIIDRVRGTAESRISSDSIQWTSAPLHGAAGDRHEF